MTVTLAPPDVSDIAALDAALRPLLMPGTGYDPLAHARCLGIEVVFRALSTVHGLWLPDYRTILIDTSRAKPWAHRNVLAHEIGHAVLGHQDDPPEHEYAADRYAASLLLTTAMVADTLKRSRGDSRQAARSLRTTTRLLRAFSTPIGPP